MPCFHEARRSFPLHPISSDCPTPTEFTPSSQSHASQIIPPEFPIVFLLEADAVLRDHTEGTVCPISFVKDTLVRHCFPARSIRYEAQIHGRTRLPFPLSDCSGLLHDVV